LIALIRYAVNNTTEILTIGILRSSEYNGMQLYCSFSTRP